MTETHVSLHSDAKSLDLAKLGPVGGLVGIVATGISIAHAMASPVNASSYLFGWIFWTGISIGMLGLLLLHHTALSPTASAAAAARSRRRNDDAAHYGCVVYATCHRSLAGA